MDIKEIGVALTGASGLIYGIRLIKYLRETGHRVVAVYTRRSVDVALHELGYNRDEYVGLLKSMANAVYCEDNFKSPLASSSSQPDALVIAPCSVKTLSGIVNGYAENVVIRSALAMLRLGRPLVLVPRETPISVVEAELLYKASLLGARIVPACPGFYHDPKSIDDLVDFIVGKILDVLGIKHSLYKKWGEERY